VPPAPAERGDERVPIAISAFSSADLRECNTSEANAYGVAGAADLNAAFVDFRADADALSEEV
jgi:hypothetical protein